jgi:hypothetical protein
VSSTAEFGQGRPCKVRRRRRAQRPAAADLRSKVSKLEEQPRHIRWFAVHIARKAELVQKLMWPY